MKYSTIRIEGSILSADILDKIGQEELPGQSNADFGLPTNRKVKDEIARAWADAQDIWRVYKRRIGRLSETGYGTSETRNFWIIPLLEMLGFDAAFSKSEKVNGKTYAISHRAQGIDKFPIHVMGFRDSLDKKRTDSGPRMSPHGLIQEYLNLTEHLYAIVSNGTYLRLLRDSSRLIKLSFIEFDLASMMDDEHFADFAIMYRLLHSSRMPQKMEFGNESLIEQYHQDALDSGSRIRAGLSQAVENSILMLGEGFLAHHDNEELNKLVSKNEIDALKLYTYLLKLIYRLLFLMVIEERSLVYPKNCNKEKRQIYYSYYSVANLRRISERSYLADQRFSDLWISLKNCFSLFDQSGKGEKLDLKPLAGDLFGRNAIGILNNCSLDNKVLITCLNNLNIFENPVTKQKMRVNYGSLNVEEFGSVYEGLLEKQPILSFEQGKYSFNLKSGLERSSSGSHYTPDELVQPLIKHSLDHIIADKLKSADPIKALLSIKVCDVACGSGHILLNAARRIGGEIAKIRSGEEQPSPEPFRQGVRDAIIHCIYGVDKNSLAVELCKVALWLEAHNPGKPLSFLDHHIKCGDAIIGLAHKEELENGIADEAFKKITGDEKSARTELAKRNKKERKTAKKREEYYSHAKYGSLEKSVLNVSEYVNQFNALPEDTPEEVEIKKKRYKELTTGQLWWHIKKLADIQVAQFFIPKTEENLTRVITDGEYRLYLSGRAKMTGPAIELAEKIAFKKRFFHWFLEFPVAFANGGFDCILGNPPYLGGQALSRTFGANFLNWVKTAYAPAGSCDLVTYFLRRIFQITMSNGFNAILSTNSISEGASREGGLDVILKNGGSLNFVQKSVRWPGVANLYVSLLSTFKGKWKLKRFLDNRTVEFISAHFEDYQDLGNPEKLKQNEKQMFQGSIFLGDGFLLDDVEKKRLVKADPNNYEVIFPLINGRDVNNSFNQLPQRHIINFFNWDEEKAQEFREPYKRVRELVKPVREKVKRDARRKYWWLYAERSVGLYNGISKLNFCFVVARTTKYLNFSCSPTDRVFTDALFVYATDNYYNYTIVQSTSHNEWARKYSSALKLDLRYSPSNCFQTFPFPQNMTQGTLSDLSNIGENYHEFRRKLMFLLELGLTKTYNLFHTKGLTVDDVQKISKGDDEAINQAYTDILRLRELQEDLENTVIKAYGWNDINLDHNFYEMEYLPENDRIRYTISPESRKEILKRLLKLNHEIYQKEVEEGLHVKGKSKKKKDKQLSLF